MSPSYLREKSLWSSVTRWFKRDASKAGCGSSEVPGASGASPAIKSSSGLPRFSNPFHLNILPCHTKHWLFSPWLALGCLKFNIALEESQSLL